MVVDASVVLPACVAGALQFPGAWQFVAPGLLWSEVTSALHEALWREELTPAEASSARATFAELPIDRREPARLRDRAWELADRLGLAKTYDAEFLALGGMLGCRVVTADLRLRRGAQRLGFVVDPVELTQLGHE